MAEINITDATCDFGLAQTDGECSRTFASFDPDAYLRSQIIYLSIGVVSVVATGLLYYRSVQFDAAKLQQRSLLFSVYVALTLIFRSADPNSYRHVIPHPIVVFFSDSSTAALYSIFILSLSYWASVIQRGAAHIQRPLDLKLFEWAAMVLVWLFYLSVDMCLFLTKGFFKPFMTYVQMLGSAGVLSLIGISFLVYGLRVRARLLHYEHQKHIMEQRNVSYQFMNVVDPNEGNDPLSDDKSRRRSQSKAGTGHAAKILKILTVVESFVLLCVCAQVYTGITRTNSGSSERDCANGFNCDSVHSAVNLMHWFQFASVWVVLWLFRKVEQRPESPASP